MIERLFRCFGAPAAAHPVPAQPQPQPMVASQAGVPPQAQDRLDPPHVGALQAPRPQVEPRPQIEASAPHRTTDAPQLAGAASDRRVLRALKNFQKTRQITRWCEVSPREDDFHTWDTKFFFTTGRMADALRLNGLDCVKLEVIFPKTYPSEAPAVRVVSPTIQVSGAGVFGGALCIDFLHKWDSTTNEEVLLASVHAALAGGAVIKSEGYSKARYDAGVKYIRAIHPDWASSAR